MVKFDPVLRVRRVHLETFKLGPVAQHTLTGSDTMVSWDEPLMIDTEADRAHVVPLRALGMMWHLFLNQVASVHASGDAEAGDLVLYEGTVDVAMAKDQRPRIARWLGVATAISGTAGTIVLDVVSHELPAGTNVVVAFGRTVPEYHVVQITTWASTTLTVLNTFAPAPVPAEPANVYVLDGATATVPPHLNTVSSGETIAPHGGAAGATGIGPHGAVVASGLVDCIVANGVSHIACPGTVRQDLAEIVAHGTPLTATYVAGHDGGTYTLAGATHVVAPGGKSCGWLLGLRPGCTSLPFTGHCPVGFFTRRVDEGAYDTGSLSATVNHAANPGIVATEVALVFYDARRRTHRIIVNPGRYPDPRDLLRGVAAAMTRAEELDTIVPDEGPVTYVVEGTPGACAIVGDGRPVRLVFPRQARSLAWDLGVDPRDGIVLSTEGRLVFTPRHGGRQSTLGAGGVFAHLAGQAPPVIRYPATRRLLTHGLPERNRFTWRQRPQVAGPPVTTSHGGNLRASVPGDASSALVVRSFYATATKHEQDDTYVVSNVAPMGVQPGDVVSIGGGTWSRTGVVGRALVVPTMSTFATNVDVPASSQRVIPGHAAVVEGSGVVTGVGTSFLSDIPAVGGQVFIVGAGVFSVGPVVANDTLTLAPPGTTSPVTATGEVFLVQVSAAAPFSVIDGSAYSVAVGSLAGIAGSVEAHNGVRTFEPLRTVVPWTPYLGFPVLRRRLGFPVFGGSLRGARVTHEAPRDLDVAPEPYVLLCVDLPVRGGNLHHYVTAPGEGYGNQVVLAKIEPGRGVVQHMPVDLSEYTTLRNIRVSLRNPDMTLFPTHGVANSLTLGVTCVPIDNIFEHAPSTSESVYQYHAT
jgi:hypothetical protein